MIRLAGQAISLVVAIALTFVATAALSGFGGVADIVWPNELPSPYYMTVEHPECLCFQPPPRLPKFIHPRVVRVRAPQILCEVPDDPAAVTDCGEPYRAE